MARLSKEKIDSILKKYPELTYLNYCVLVKNGLSNGNIRHLYKLSYEDLGYFVKNNSSVLKVVRNWA